MLEDLRFRNPNLIWSTVVADTLVRAGVKTVCISPGSRSAPLVVAIAAQARLQNSLEALVHIDERCGSFFALGLAKATKTPVVLLCTSGTAAANYFPAIIEAYYSQVPLIVLTADRPPELRDCGAGQTIDQIKIYGEYVRYFFEVGKPEMSELRLQQVRSLIYRAVQICQSPQSGVVHLNFAFADPLAPVYQEVAAPIVSLTKSWLAASPTHPQSLITNLADQATVSAIANQIQLAQTGIIVVGGFSQAAPGFEQSVKKLAEITGFPLFAEATGICRGDTISTYDFFLRSPELDFLPELIIRFGEMPTSKSFFKWLNRFPDSQQIIIGSPINNDPTYGNTQFLPVDALNLSDRLLEILTHRPQNPKFSQLHLLIKETISEFMAPIAELFEGKIYHELAQWLPNHLQIYVASSSAIRDLDAFFHGMQQIKFLANRGANGIEGTISSALGASWTSEIPNILICGDLAFYHDLNGLMAAKQYSIDLTIILINNDGGGVFQMLPIAEFDPPYEQFFATPHGLDFAPIVQAYGCKYHLIQTWTEFQTLTLQSLIEPGVKVLELKTNRHQSHSLRQECDRLIQLKISEYLKS